MNAFSAAGICIAIVGVSIGISEGQDAFPGRLRDRFDSKQFRDKPVDKALIQDENLADGAGSRLGEEILLLRGLNLKDREDFRLMLNNQLPKEPSRISKLALADYLNSGANMPDTVRQFAFNRFVQDAEKTYGETEVYAPGDPQIIRDLKKFRPKPPDRVPDEAADSEALQLRLNTMARSVGIIVRSSQVQRQNKTFDIQSFTFRQEEGLCPGTPFEGCRCLRPAGTGFLIASDLVATAGHCADDIGSGLSIIFGFTDEECAASDASNPQSDFLRLSKERVAVHKLELLSRSPKALRDEEDWAIFKIVGEPSLRTPLPLNDGAMPDMDINLFMVGHPGGMPLRITTTGKILETLGGNLFTNLDAFAGNSGSPVINSITLKVEGILVNGGKDYEWVADKKCYKWVMVAEIPEKDENDSTLQETRIPLGERVGRILPIVDEIKKYQDAR